MKEGKILLVTDAHFSKKSELGEERWFPRIAERKGKPYLKYWDNLTQIKFLKVLTSAKLLGPFDYFIDLGDSTPGINQRGLLNQRAIEERLEYQRLIDKSFPEIPKYYLWGDHDVGYRSGKILEILGLGTKNGRMTKESFRVAEKIIGPPWKKISIGGYTILLLNSEIIREYKNSSDDKFFKSMVKKQDEFIERELVNSEKIIILIHDPLLLLELKKMLLGYQEKISMTISGHAHMGEAGKLYRIHPLMRTINLQVIPSPWGLGMPWGAVGQGGFGILEIKNKEVKLKRLKI